MSFHVKSARSFESPTNDGLCKQHTSCMHGHLPEWTGGEWEVSWCYHLQDLQWTNHLYTKIGKATRTLGFLRQLINLGHCTPSVKL